MYALFERILARFRLCYIINLVYFRCYDGSGAGFNFLSRPPKSGLSPPTPYKYKPAEAHAQAPISAGIHQDLLLHMHLRKPAPAQNRETITIPPEQFCF